MTAWIELLSRELIMLALLGAIGAGPVALLHRSYDRATRLALAPAYGLALGMCVLTTGLWRVPGYKLAWIGLVPLVIASVAVALIVRRRQREPEVPEDRGGIWQAGAVVAVVLIALSWPLASRDTVGPIGGYDVADAVGYTAEIDGAQEQSIHTIANTAGPFGDLTLAYWAGVSRGFQQIGFDSLEAPAAELLGLQATDVLAPFLIAVMAATALGIFAAVRMLTRSRSPAAMIAGWLAAGPLFIQLLMDGSQGALVGQALILPFALAVHTALVHRRWTDLLLVGLMAAGLQTGYPLFVPPVVFGAAIVLLVLLTRERRVPRCIVVGLPGLLVLAAALTPYAFSRNAEYWLKVARGEFSFEGLPVYDLQAEFVPGWLLQTREFYDFYGLLPVADNLVTVGLLPAALVVLAVLGIVRFRVAGWLVALVAACAFLALYTVEQEGCSYCAQRNLLPLGPVVAALIGVGLVAVARRSRIAAVVAAVVVLVAVADKHESMSLRERNAAYLLDTGVRDVLERLPQDGPVHLEGFGQSSKAPMEHPLVYHAANEATTQQVSLVAMIDDGSSQQYIGGARATGPELRVDWRYVITRHGEVDSGRRVLARAGPIALEGRRRLDVTVEGGTGVAMSNVDSRGRAWLNPALPLRFIVWAGDTAPAWVRVVLHETGNINVRAGNDLDARRLRGGRIEIYVKADGSGPARLAEIQMDQTPGPAPPAPSAQFAIPAPVSGGYIESLRATARDCSPLRSSHP